MTRVPVLVDIVASRERATSLRMATKKNIFFISFFLCSMQQFYFLNVFSTGICAHTRYMFE